MDGNEILTVFLAEDEQPARDLLLEYIFKREELKMEGWSKNGKETYDKLSEKEYDIIFLDINLPVMSGIEILEKLKNPPYVIFTTAYNDYAIKAFELGAIDYLLKPFSEERFNNAVDKALSIIKNKGPYPRSITRLGLAFRSGESHFIIGYEDIIYISSEGRHSSIHTETRVYKTHQSLKELGLKLPADSFIRIHREYIVNLRYISQVQYLIGGQYAAFLKDEAKTTLTVGRIYSSALRKKLTI